MSVVDPRPLAEAVPDVDDVARFARRGQRLSAQPPQGSFHYSGRAVDYAAACDVATNARVAFSLYRKNPVQLSALWGDGA